MQRISRAPVLSATRSRDSCWITGRPPCRSCPPAAKSERGKDAGSPHRDALQRAGGCEMGGGRPSLLRHLDDLGQAPALRLGDRARLDDADDVTDLGGVLLVVRVELDRAADDLLVLGVRL